MRVATLSLLCLTLAGCCKPGAWLGKEEPTSKDPTKKPATDGDKTPPPSAAEWASAQRLNVPGEPDGCEVRKVREWYQAYCRHCENHKRAGGIVCSEKATWGAPQMHRGSKGNEIFFYDKKDPKTFASSSTALLPLRAGTDVEITFPGSGGPDVTLVAFWPKGGTSAVLRFK
jgi:hypothetical protein